MRKNVSTLKREFRIKNEKIRNHARSTMKVHIKRKKDWRSRNFGTKEQRINAQFVRS